MTVYEEVNNNIHIYICISVFTEYLIHTRCQAISIILIKVYNLIKYITQLKVPSEVKLLVRKVKKKSYRSSNMVKIPPSRSRNIKGCRGSNTWDRLTSTES